MPDIEKVIKGLETCRTRVNCKECPYAYDRRADDSYCEAVLHNDVLELLKEQEAVVHPEPSCEMKYITDCCCDLCGVQLIREDNFCRGCGKPIGWKKSLFADGNNTGK